LIWLKYRVIIAMFWLKYKYIYGSGRGNNTSFFAMQGWQEETPATTSIWEHLSFFNIGRINVANPIWKGKT